MSKRVFGLSQLSDCHRGVVIDGLETQYCRSPSNTLQIVLKALNNRHHIYFINLFNSYSVFKRRWLYTNDMIL